MGLAAAVSPFRKRSGASTLVEHVAQRFFEREEARCESGDISPNTLRELRRFVRPDGEFSRWNGWDVNAITYAELEDWRLELGRRVSAKTAKNIICELRRMMRWLHRRGELVVLPEFPEIPLDTKAPEILMPEEQKAVLAAIPWQRRGVFLAMSHTLRENEARAIDLYCWNEPYMVVQRAAKLTSANAPIRGLKERDWKVIGASDELVEWVRWRIERATSAELLRRKDVLLFVNWTARNPLRMWSAWAIRDEWVRACEKAGVRYVSPYPSTRHSTATDLLRTGKASIKQVQTLLGHKAASSTEVYTRLAGGGSQDLFRDTRVTGTAQGVSRDEFDE